MIQTIAISLCCVLPAAIFVAGSCFNIFVWFQSDYWCRTPDGRLKW